jgi:outer membrane protein
MKINKLILIFIYIISILPITAFGEINRKGPLEGLSLGAGYIYSRSVYSGVRSRHISIPFFSYKSGNFFLRGFNGSYKLHDKGNLKSSFVIDGNFFSGGYEADDSSILSEMDERKGTISVGTQLSLKVNKLQFSVKILKDLINVHGGIEAEFDIGTRFPISILFKSMPFTMIGASYGYKYSNEKYNNYYYGVKVSEANVGRSSYSTSSSLSPYFSSFVLMNLAPRWTLMSIYRVQWIPDEIKSSPIVDKDKLFTVITFITYKY